METVAAIIEACIANQERVLDLGNCGLVDLAQCERLEECTHVEVLVLGPRYWKGDNGEDSKNTGQKNRIKDISVLAKLPQLKELYIGGQEVLEDISVLAELSGLEVLGLSSNCIQDISPLANINTLKRLYLRNNKIKDISPLRNLKNLAYLGLDENGLEDISALAGLTSLEKLYLNKNKIKDISALAGLGKLTLLTMDENAIEDISALAGLTALEKLYLNKNKIKDISALAGLDILKVLNLSNNGVWDITHLAGLEELEILFLDNNGCEVEIELPRKRFFTGYRKIYDLSPLAGLRNLEILSCENNYIRDLAPLSNLKNLKKLFLSKNEILDITPLANLVQLETLYLGNNEQDPADEQIADLGLEADEVIMVHPIPLGNISVLSNLTALKVLSIQSNGISNISALAGCLKLEKLYATNNQIKDVSPLSALKELKILYLPANQIEDISALAELDGLSKVILSHNKIEDASPLQYLPELEHLDLDSKVPQPQYLESGRRIELKGWQLKNLIAIPQHQSDNQSNQASKNQDILIYPKLKYLSLSNSTILSEELAYLRNLETLYYCGSELRADFYSTTAMIETQGWPSVWDGWKKEKERGPLKTLDFLKSMPNLQALSLRYHSIDDLSALAYVPNLRLLDISHNHIKNITPIKHLQYLWSLYIAGNPILDISILGEVNIENQVVFRETEIIGDEFLEFGYKETLEPYEIGTYLEKIPAEIRGGASKPVLVKTADLIANKYEKPSEKSGNEAILKYWLDTYVNRPLREAKIVFVGEGAAGKTSLIHQLLGKSFEEGRTEKIEIHTTEQDFFYQPKEDAPKEPLKIHFWDFGGQEIMHATHKFFMNHHSVYVFVINGRTDNENESDKWIELLQTSISNAPVILVVNQLDGNEPHRIGDTEMQKRLPSILRPVIETSCRTGRGIQALKEAIQQQLQHFDGFKHQVVPEKYVLARQKLEALRRPYIDTTTFKQICSEVAKEQATNFDRGSQRLFVHQLNTTGAMLNFQEKNRELEDLYIFDPSWIIDGIYKIINSPVIANAQGRITKDVFYETLDSEKYSTHQERNFILSMMLHFKLAFLRTTTPVDADTQVFITSLFGRNRPAQLDAVWQAHTQKTQGNILHYEFEYELWRNDYITYFLVETHHALDANLYWLHGGLLNYPEDVCAFVEADRSKKIISIKISGLSDKRPALQQIRYALQKVHSLFDTAKLGVSEYVYYEGEALDVEELKSELLDGQKTYRIPRLKKNVDIQGVLHGIQPDKLARAYKALLQKDFITAEDILRELHPAEAKQFSEDLQREKEKIALFDKLDAIHDDIKKVEAHTASILEEVQENREFYARIDAALATLDKNKDYSADANSFLNTKQININKLQPQTLTYLYDAFHLYLAPISADFSLPIGQFCRALEYEFKKRICDNFPNIKPSQAWENNPPTGLKDIYKTVAEGKGNYTYGNLTFFLRRLFKDGEINNSNTLIRAWRNYFVNQRFSISKIDQSFIQQAIDIGNDYRNPAAHTGQSFTQLEAETCVNKLCAILKKWTNEILN